MNQLLFKTEKRSFLNWLKNQGSVVIGFLILFISLSVLSESFLTFSNLINVARQMSISMITAIGMTLIIITAGIDLSVGSTFALTGTLFAFFVSRLDMPIIFALLLVLAFGYVLGMGKGWCIATQGLQPFILTLALMTILSGFAYILTGGRPLAINSEEFRWIGRGSILNIPVPVIIMIIVIIIGHIILSKTKFGRHIYAFGGNPEASRLCGVNVKWLVIHVYGIGTMLAALSGIILSSRISAGSPNVGVGGELDAIAAVVLGGTSLMGGKGNIIGTIFGAMVIAVLSNGMNLLNVSSYHQLVVKGLVILMSVWINNIKLRKGV